MLKLAESSKGKMPKIKSDSRIGKAIKEIQKTAVAP